MVHGVEPSWRFRQEGPPYALGKVAVDPWPLKSFLALRFGAKFVGDLLLLERSCDRPHYCALGWYRTRSQASKKKKKCLEMMTFPMGGDSALASMWFLSGSKTKTKTRKGGFGKTHPDLKPKRQKAQSSSLLCTFSSSRASFLWSGAQNWNAYSSYDGELICIPFSHGPLPENKSPISTGSPQWESVPPTEHLL